MYSKFPKTFSQLIGKIIEVLYMNENIQQTQINRILEIVEGHKNRFNGIDKRFEAMEERFDILSRQIRHRELMSRLEATAEQYDKPLTTMITEIGRRIDKIDKMRNRIIGLFLGIMLPMWVSILITIWLKM